QGVVSTGAQTPGLFGFQHPETTPASIPTKLRTAPRRLCHLLLGTDGTRIRWLYAIAHLVAAVLTRCSTLVGVGEEGALHRSIRAPGPRLANDGFRCNRSSRYAAVKDRSPPEPTYRAGTKY